MRGQSRRFALPSCLGSPVLARVGRPRRGWFTCHQMRARLLFPAMGNHPASAWSAGGEPGPTPELILFAAFSRPLSRCYPWLHRTPRLCLWCAEETSSAQWTICVPCLHLLIRRRQEARKGRGAGGDQVHPEAFSAFRTSSCLGRRNRTCPVTLLAVHAASAHEAGGGGSFQERPHTLLQLYAAVPSAPPHAAAPSAMLKRKERLPAALALAAAA
jgi:hypothetical protein